jgi:hypothetical protein
MVGVDRRVQQRTTSWHQPSAPVPKVPPTCIRRSTVFGDLLSSFEAPIHWAFPGVVEGVSRELLFALKVPVDSAFF